MPRIPSPRRHQLIGIVVAGALALLASVLLRGPHPSDEDHLARPSSAPPPHEPVRENGSAVEQTQELTLEEKLERKLVKIHDLIADAQNWEGTYPASLAPESGFGWIAAIARKELPEIPVDPQHPWNALGNDDFVRRRFPMFENPILVRTPGSDGLPPSHFVGITGVGVNAASLPKAHPRAGVFGHNRHTQTSEVRDGLANTIMIAGVNNRFGSWARDDYATMRGFEREPYVNGPDGFGTGQPDSMLVLNADGSIRTISVKTDPLIVRRLAAMADGLPLDLSVAGDPLTMDAPVAPQELTTEDPAEDKPLSVEFAPDQPAFQIQDRLGQRILSYKLETPVPVRQLMLELEELVGVPFVLQDVPHESLEINVRLAAENLSVGDLMAQILLQAGLTFEVQDYQIVIQLKS
ncbi:MAG: hypothetical protein KDA80_16590 [Planctomycetaceae bacterium]|nr:hypothetical protein [Planctomycetaceae bacterium]